jgi:HAD superfamily hydrolase (TIGR01509 family)
MPLEALIFDVDGTLAETEELHRQAFNAAFRAFWLDWTWDRELYRELLKVTGGKERIRHYIQNWRPSGSDAALAKIHELHAEKTARYAALVYKHAAAPRPGVLRLLTQAHEARLPIAIATTTMPDNVNALLEAILGADAPAWFSTIAAGDMVRAKKPAPDIYQYAVEKLGVAAAACVAFEDSANGVQAARGAGIAVVATPSLYASDDDFSQATSLLSDLGEPDRPHKYVAGWRFNKGFVDLAGLAAFVALR